MFAALYRLLSSNEQPSNLSLQALGFEINPQVQPDGDVSDLFIDDSRTDSNKTTTIKGSNSEITGKILPPEPTKPDWSFPICIISQRTAIESGDQNQLLDVSPFAGSDDAPCAHGQAPAIKPLLNDKALRQTLLRAFVEKNAAGPIDARRLSERAASHRSLLPIPRKSREQPVQRFWVLIDYLPEFAWDVDHLQHQFLSMPAQQRPHRQIRLTADSVTWLDEHDQLHPGTTLPRIAEEFVLLIVANPVSPSSALLPALRRIKRHNTLMYWLSTHTQEATEIMYWGEPGNTPTADAFWDRQASVSRGTRTANKGSIKNRQAVAENNGISDIPITNKVIEQMKTLLWPFYPITQAAVRDLRLMLGGSTSDEQMFWKSISRGASELLGGKCSIHDPEERQYYYQQLIEWVTAEPEKVKEFYRLLQPHLDAMTATFRHRVVLNLPAQLVDSEDREKAETFFASLAVSAKSIAGKDKSAHQRQCAVILQMAHGLQTNQSPKLGAAIEIGQQGYRQYDPGAALLRNNPSASLDRQAVSEASLVISSEGLILSDENTTGAIATLDYSRGGIALETVEHRTPRLIQLNEPLPQTLSTLHTANERIDLQPLDSEPFHFAESLWQDSEGVHLSTQQNLRIDYPAAGGGPVFDVSDAPDWLTTCELGIDEFGLWAEMQIATVPVVMRWIAPGHFLMGSPEDEPERHENETQHPVTLSHGYWLAETACTQRLWAAVMGENPSVFKRPDRPVEMVSWGDVQKFFKGVKNKSGIELTLPTEAQWEYACRAGSTTPFNVGGTISTDQVNFDGNYPYGDSPKGEYREETVDAKYFEPNDWGLYQMHGNVREWCDDWYGEYPAEEQVNPTGSPAGDRRVLRGGSWFNDAQYCRSAYRYGYGPSWRNGSFGFRFAQVTGAPAGAERPGSSRHAGRTKAPRSEDSRGLAGQILERLTRYKRKKNE